MQQKHYKAKSDPRHERLALHHESPCVLFFSVLLEPISCAFFAKKKKKEDFR
jgi:hypothetical protein